MTRKYMVWSTNFDHLLKMDEALHYSFEYYTHADSNVYEKKNQIAEGELTKPLTLWARWTNIFHVWF